MSGAEYMAAKAAHNPRVLAYVFQYLDGNGDGIITPEEIQQNL